MRSACALPLAAAVKEKRWALAALLLPFTPSWDIRVRLTFPHRPSPRNRLGRPEVRDRIQNLYFAYLFVLRAVMKAAPLLARYDYGTGLEAEDAATTQLVQQLVGGGWRKAGAPQERVCGPGGWG